MLFTSLVGTNGRIILPSFIFWGTAAEILGLHHTTCFMLSMSEQWDNFMFRGSANSLLGATIQRYFEGNKRTLHDISVVGDKESNKVSSGSTLLVDNHVHPRKDHKITGCDTNLPGIRRWTSTPIALDWTDCL
ncbi:hypothetical protein V8B97DRAFT_1456382 [Scleroderma yunnanense]